MNDNPRVIELPKSGPIRWLGFALVFVVTICCVGVSILPFALDDTQYFRKSIHLRQTGVIVPGTVSEVESNVDKEEFIVGVPDSVSYRLTVEYTVDGQTYTVRNQKFVNGYDVGDTINVIYDPADPTISQVDIFSERWFDPIMELIP
jgi:Protein of unknown function (DUF3592)